jgi:hypothetical protein
MMRTGVRVAMIAGAVVLGLSAGTAGALAATGRGGADDPPGVVEDAVGTPAPTPSPSGPRPVPTTIPAPAVVDDHGGAVGGHGADDPATHDAGDDHGGHGGHGRHGSDD